MVINFKSRKVKLLTYLYFVIAFIEVLAEAFSVKLAILITKPLIPLLLMVLYFFTSSSNGKMFYFVMFFSLLTNLLFIPNSEQALYFGIVAYTIHRVFLFILIFKIVKIKSFISFFVATLPLGFIFFYLFSAAVVPPNSYHLLFFHNIMAACLGGLAISCYVANDSKENSLLMISVLLFLGLQLVIFIERYYLADSHSNLLRPLAMLLNVMAFFVFYKFVIAAENKSNNN